MTEKQPYSVLERRGKVEVRRYPEHTVAQVRVGGQFDSAGNKGFRPLFDYIRQGQVSMTAPVLQTRGEQEHEVAFVMPAGRSPESLPAPQSGDVQLRVIPAATVAALRFSGWGNAKDFERQAAQLRAALAGSPWTPVGPVRLARFDPPYKPPFLRHNEVVVDVVASGPDGS